MGRRNKKNKQIRSLLHKKRQAKVKAEKEKKQKMLHADDELNIATVPVSLLKSGNRTSALNQARRNNSKRLLNKYNHPDSKHIRLKPYFDSKKIIEWSAVLADITLPNTHNLVGNVLLDKIAIGNFDELIDYHLWLNLENVKYIYGDNVKLGIGDIIHGFSFVKKYSGNKYGLAETVITDAGVFADYGQKVEIITNYDRQDDWVVELKNTNASNRAYSKYQQSHKKSDFLIVSGHVDTIYQPSRYMKFRERLKPLEKTDNTVVPLFNTNGNEYLGKIAQFHIDLVDGTLVPKLQFKTIYNKFGRLLAVGTTIEYTKEIQKLGKLSVNDEIIFAADSKDNKLCNFRDFRINRQKIKKCIPQESDLFLGMLMLETKSVNADPKLIKKYLTWKVKNSADNADAKEQLMRFEANEHMTQEELAEEYGIEPSMIAEYIKQGVICAKDNLFDAKQQQITREVYKLKNLPRNANLSKGVADKLGLYRIDRLFNILNMPQDVILQKLKSAGYKSLLDKQNVYGPNAVKILKASQSAITKLPVQFEPAKDIKIPKAKKKRIKKSQNKNESLPKSKAIGHIFYDMEDIANMLNITEKQVHDCIYKLNITPIAVGNSGEIINHRYYSKEQIKIISQEII